MASPILVGAVITLVAYWLYDFIRARGKHYPPGTHVTDPVLEIIEDFRRS